MMRPNYYLTGIQYLTRWREGSKTCGIAEARRVFSESKNPNTRLAAALYLLLPPVYAAFTDDGQKYSDYIGARIRPALEILVRIADTEGISFLEKADFLTPAVLESALALSIECRQAKVTSFLLVLKAQKYGFPDRDFSLPEGKLTPKNEKGAGNAAGNPSFRRTGQGERGNQSTSEKLQLSAISSGTHALRSILRSAMVTDEEQQLDEDSFDYIYYHVGMEAYGNIPLIEPLEYKEVRRIDEIVIAVDTSGSIKPETASRFLAEIRCVFEEEGNFFWKMKAVLLQCDYVVNDMAILQSRREWWKYQDSFILKGRGGTDFRPVFRKVEELRRAGMLSKPRILLYFTDGDGAFPDTAPDYPAVFILSGEKSRDAHLPPWVTRIRL